MACIVKKGFVFYLQPFLGQLLRVVFCKWAFAEGQRAEALAFAEHHEVKNQVEDISGFIFCNESDCKNSQYPQ